MGWSPLDEKTPSDDALIGDEPFDLVSDCLRAVAEAYQRDLERKPSLREIVGTVQAVLEVQLQDHTSDGESAELTALTFKTRKIPKRQKYGEGDILRATAANGEPIYARIFEIDSSIGPLVGVYDSLGMPQTDLAAIRQRPLVVKVFPIHRENLEDRAEWLVIGNAPITPGDAEQPRGPVSLSGANAQLEAANYYYKLGPKTFYDVEKYLVRTNRGGPDA